MSAYNFTVEELENVFQFKTTGNGTVYFDNIYFWKAPAAQGTDISLSALTVDGSSIADFGALKTSYSLELPAGTTVVPTVAATPTDTNASAVVTAATSLPGTTTVVVTAQDGVTTNTVSIAFTLESTDNGADPTPTLLIEFNNSEAFVGQGGVTYSEATDPTDSTNTVGKMEGGGAQYSSLIGLQLDTYIDMTTSEKTITFQFYTTEAVPMNGMLQLNGEQDGGNPIEMRFTTDGNIGWETITLDFNDAKNGYPYGDVPVVYGQYATVNVFSNFGDTGSSTYYIDAIRGAANGAAVGSGSGTDPDPVTGLIAAPTPSQDSADVIAVYSDAYTSIATALDPFWGQQTDATEIQIDGNLTLKYANLNYQGLEYPQTDVSAMEYVHLDYYTDDATALDFFLISADPYIEIPYSIPIVTGSWQSVDIPLSAYIFTVEELENVFQFKTEGNGTVWFDNLYFWKAPAAQGTDTSLSALTVDGSSIADFGAFKKSYSVELPAGTTVAPAVVATPTDTNASAVVTAATSIPGTTTIAVTAQDGVTTNTVSIAWTLDPKPQTAAPTPSQASADVISVYSDAFTENIATNLNLGWGQATQTTEVQIDGNNTLEYANLNYQGLEYAQTDVSAMDYVHLDYYTNDAKFLEFFLKTNGVGGIDENAYDIAASESFAIGQWVSLDIPLIFFSDAGQDLAKAFQFKTEGNGTVYLDNLYFWKAPAAQGTDTSLSALTVDGSSIADFGAFKKSYSVELPAETTVVPTVAATTTDTNASAVVTAATSIPGTTTIVVTAQDGITTTTFSIAFTLEATNSAAAPTPSQDSADVISVYSDVYTSIATILNPDWGQATQTSEFQIDGNNTLEYANLNYQGLQYPATDVSAMEYVHLDYKTDDATALDFFLISANPTVENAFSITIVTGSWQSIDIPLSVYTANLDRVFNFKTVGNGTVYLDNLYFWKAPAAAGTDSSLSALTVDGSSIADFGAFKKSYSVELPAETTVVPTVAATTTDTNASAVVTAATSIPGTTTVAITSQDGSATRTISIAWTLDPKPQTAAPTPSQDSANVISVYSDVYTSIATNLNPNWGQQTQTAEVLVDGNNTLEYASLNYQGLEYPQTDVSAMEYVHLDYFTNDATALDFFLISADPYLENAYSIPVVIGSWQSIDIPLSEYTVPELDKIFQFKTTGNGTVWFDNIYFWKAPVAQGTDTSLSALTVDGSTIADFEALKTSYSVELPAETTVAPTVAATTTDTNASAVVTAATSIPGTTTIAITAQDGVTTSTISIAWTLDPKPQTAAPIPSQDSADVISVYSDAYTSIATELNPGWGQQTQTAEVLVDGNNTLEYASLNYQGLEYPQTDVSAMEYVHLDYFTNDATALDFFLISADPYLENAYSIPVVIGSWQSIDIPLSEYTVPELDKIFQFKTTGNGTVWFDNIYFWKAPAAAGTDTSLSALTVDGSSIVDFGALKTSYSVELPAGTTVVPTVAATTEDTNASAVVTAATSLPGTTTVVVTAQDGATTSTVSINWTLASTPPNNTSAPPTPNKAPADVISVYSDAYTSNATDIDPFWGQQTDATEILIDGNNTLEYANLNYQGLEYPATDVSAMEYVHLDYKTDDATALDFYLISENPTVENAYTLSIVTGDWQSIDIPLSVYTANLDRVLQFKTTGNGTVYLDNLYFWKAPAAAGTDISLSALTVNGSTIVDFGALKTSYSVELPAGTTVVPTVAATTDRHKCKCCRNGCNKHSWNNNRCDYIPRRKCY